MVDNGEESAAAVIEAVENEIKKEPLARIDYVEAVNYNNLKPLIKIQKPLLCAIAVYIGKTRLIDNFIVE